MRSFWGVFTYLSCSRPGARFHVLGPEGLLDLLCYCAKTADLFAAILGIVLFAFRLHKECPMACRSRSVMSKRLRWTLNYLAFLYNQKDPEKLSCVGTSRRLMSRFRCM